MKKGTIASILILFVVLSLLCARGPSTISAPLRVNLGIQFSGHLIPYVGISRTYRGLESGFDLGLALPHEGMRPAEIGYSGSVFFRPRSLNYLRLSPELRLRVLFPPPAANEDSFLLMVGFGVRYFNYLGAGRIGGGVELDMGLPVSALDELSGPIPSLSFTYGFRVR